MRVDGDSQWIVMCMGIGKLSAQKGLLSGLVCVDSQWKVVCMVMGKRDAHEELL